MVSFMNSVACSWLLLDSVVISCCSFLLYLAFMLALIRYSSNSYTLLYFVVMFFYSIYASVIIFTIL